MQDNGLQSFFDICLTFSKAVIAVTFIFPTVCCKGRTIRKLIGGGGGVEKKFAQGKIKLKKLLASQLILKNIHVMA